MTIKYVEDLGWPWTPEKVFCGCRWCFKGTGVFGDLKLMLAEPVAYVHTWCMREIESEEPCTSSTGQ